jgi:hypothetical protein
LRLADLLPAPGADPMDVVDVFVTWAAEGGRPLYPHQEEAVIALASGDHVVLATPTGSGKSLVADGRHPAGAQPWRALGVDGADQGAGGREVLRPRRPARRRGGGARHRRRRHQQRRAVLVCTAEVLANQALAEGAASDFGFACLDEFHYYAERDRGWAWQVPLLEHRCQFLLASATLGDMTAISTDLERAVRSHRHEGHLGGPAHAALPRSGA